MTFEIQRLEGCHLSEILELEKLCFPDPYSIKTLESSLISERNVSLVCMIDGHVAGYIELGDFIDTLSVNRIATHPDHRKKGVAAALLDRARETAMQKQIAELSLEVRTSNTAARALYEKFGFTLAGRRPNYYRDPKEDAAIYIMKL